MLMPLGSKAFQLRSGDGDRQTFVAEDGVEISLPTAELAIVPKVGESVTLSMLVNIASPAAVVSLRWDGGFEVVGLSKDAISKPMVEHFYEGSAIIGMAVEAGQAFIADLHRIVDGRSEPVEAFVDDYLDSAAVALDILQIYRAPVVTAFSSELPSVADSRWRTEAFRAWEPAGIASILDDSIALADFLRVCGATIGAGIDREALAVHDVSLDEAEAIEAQLFELFNQQDLADYREVVARLDAEFRHHGLRLFGETGSAELFSLV